MAIARTDMAIVRTELENAIIEFLRKDFRGIEPVVWCDAVKIIRVSDEPDSFYPAGDVEFYFEHV